MAGVCKRAAAVLDGGHATQGSETGCKRRRFRIDTTADYEEMSCLGEGGFGVVVKARHRATGKIVAIKFLTLPDDTEEPANDVRGLLREARFLEACNGNPYVVGFHGLVRNEVTGSLSFAMEFVGPSLHDFLQERRRSPPLPEATVRAFMWKLLTGAKKMHECHVIHRDIKPTNVLVAEGGELVKICDLGLAVSMSEPPPYSEAGTMSYMAPEMLLGKPDYDALVDMWSLGCVMAELITGKRLFQVNDDNEIRQLWTIFSTLGLPDDRTWPEFTSLPVAASVPRLLLEKHNRLRELFPEEMLSKDGFEVLGGLLTCNPDKRLTAAAALKLPWFAPPCPAAAAKVDVFALPRKEVAPALPRKKVAPALRRKKVAPALPRKKVVAVIPMNALIVPLALWKNAQRV